ncbi:MAG: hypothetical protein EOS36_21395 [Mesorhizobium sp.]|uniref:hypothetical protein n=1 Tax=Mesorhizobium sp. TaxID=1871066 RepID=UPI000FE78DF5|nr:hypothetical protein [Mesorhizobium sp.]RWD60337.1 MAG: hypothetical protein EOS36_21395 [Mesorhizobium sp.]RWE47778.1 MAG: hypothetical protein EOS79_09865 [Mesorhizobium sp.]
MTAIVNDARKHLGGVAVDRQRERVFDVEGGEADVSALAFAHGGKAREVVPCSPKTRQPQKGRRYNGQQPEKPRGRSMRRAIGYEADERNQRGHGVVSVLELS